MIAVALLMLFAYSESTRDALSKVISRLNSPEGRSGYQPGFDNYATQEAQQQPEDNDRAKQGIIGR